MKQNKRVALAQVAHGAAAKAYNDAENLKKIRSDANLKSANEGWNSLNDMNTYIRQMFGLCAQVARELATPELQPYIANPGELVRLTRLLGADSALMISEFKDIAKLHEGRSGNLENEEDRIRSIQIMQMYATFSQRLQAGPLNTIALMVEILHNAMNAVQAEVTQATAGSVTQETQPDGLVAPPSMDIPKAGTDGVARMHLPAEEKAADATEDLPT